MILMRRFPQPTLVLRMCFYQNLPSRAKRIALGAFHRLAVAEAAVHGLTVDTVHFHEVGAIDSIVDIVGAAVLLDYVGADKMVVSPLPVGRGIIYGAAHGKTRRRLEPETYFLLESSAVHGWTLAFTFLCKAQEVIVIFHKHSLS